ncbi:polysaccharide pyruvyl transferase family protein [Mariniphaga sediminis]|uniref:Polysaccharide pyruvyl transferase family protein n=1 Tax=Mariniphaga sediminis TaxID=1628158 RepID=A0A399CX63_9BACT|nr:polysaccharide pyruvyl transferase family protein [Mariniphaga sediminis]RIH63806.1 polysaccharide pyruvyl transferase family protein [Mariniphaga sediminis]
MKQNSKYTQLNRRNFIGHVGVVSAGLTLGVKPWYIKKVNSKSMMKEKKCSRIMIGYVWRLESTPGGNIGDYAITPGLVTLLEHNFPKYQVTALNMKRSSKFRIYNELHGFPKCDVVDDALSSVFSSELLKIKNEFGGTLPIINSSNIDIVFDKFASGIINRVKQEYPQFIDVLLETCLFIYNSGMILVYGEETLAGSGPIGFWNYTVLRSLPLLIAWKLGIPYGIYAHSFDSFGDVNDSGQPYFRKLLENAKFVFCRDSNSVDYVKSLQINAPNLMFVPDSTISANQCDNNWASEFMKRNGLNQKRFLIIVARTWNQGDRGSSTIGRKRGFSHMEKMRHIISQWVLKTGMKVIITSEVESDFNNVAEFIYYKLPENIRSSCIMPDAFWTTEQAVALYRQARIIVTMEVHSFLMAIPQGTPTIVPTFSESGRKIWMLNDFKLNDWLFDIDNVSAEQIEDTIFKINDQYQHYSDLVNTKVIPYLKNIEDRAMKIVGKALVPEAK